MVRVVLGPVSWASAPCLATETSGGHRRRWPVLSQNRYRTGRNLQRFACRVILAGAEGRMWLLLLPLKLRYLLLSTALAGLAACAVLVWWLPGRAAVLAFPLLFFGFFSVLGLRDFFQSRHAILRNYPITAH